jgi:acyl carrier protein
LDNPATSSATIKRSDFFDRISEMTMTKEEIFEQVRESLVDALGVDEDEVTADATLVGDLGAESIDFLDIVFKLEKSFGISIPREELSPEDILTSSQYVQNGLVTPGGMSELKKRMPWADLSKFELNPRVQDFGNLLTVGDMCNYVATKI